MKKVLSLFSGCGGMDLGFEGDFDVPASCVNLAVHPQDWYQESQREGWVHLKKTSFETVFANDILDYAEAAWKTYFAKRGTDVESVFHKGSIVDAVKAHKNGEQIFPEDIDVVTGGFPCQDFSVAGNRGGFNSHKNHHNQVLDEIPSEETRGKLYLWMRDVIEITQPKVFIAENVKGLVSLGDVKAIIENDFRNIGDGYIVVPAKVLMAGDYGVAQRRERVIFIGLSKKYLKADMLDKVLNGEFEVYPPATHAEQPVDKRKAFSQCGQVLEGLVEPELSKDKAQQAFSKAKYLGKGQGQTEVNYWGLGPTIRSEHHGNIEFRRLAEENKGKIVHELEQGLPQRRLTVRECARIQSFPDDYDFVFTAKQTGKYKLSGSGAYKVIGNAVPPLMAFNIAKHIESIWDEIF
ncbi:DNA (cytosine-5-)-methyltransferase [Vibrio sp. SCSIO 43136]|uniref:DNA cytosine methyltransferase n=1 Tax=Vibrio sp. SCSIO 43136 TaxID=2819101 RepID=UPI0020760EB4|nr:DNA (cytosine-5-)-methyltransferase [Vibrio sp. SCSIO 43136]USD64530.1 DNA (cytosine-5-)-methyltransferase [Vibrio sp. SCSIO 43136]